MHGSQAWSIRMAFCGSAHASSSSHINKSGNHLMVRRSACRTRSQRCAGRMRTWTWWGGRHAGRDELSHGLPAVRPRGSGQLPTCNEEVRCGGGPGHARGRAGGDDLRPGLPGRGRGVGAVLCDRVCGGGRGREGAPRALTTPSTPPPLSSRRIPILPPPRRAATHQRHAPGMPGAWQRKRLRALAGCHHAPHAPLAGVAVPARAPCSELH